MVAVSPHFHGQFATCGELVTGLPTLGISQPRVLEVLVDDQLHPDRTLWSSG
jgi:hypothetical protein